MQTQHNADIYAHLYMESQDEPARIMDEILTPVLVTLPQPQGLKILFQIAHLPFNCTICTTTAPLKTKPASSAGFTPIYTGISGWKLPYMVTPRRIERLT